MNAEVTAVRRGDGGVNVFGFDADGRLFLSASFATQDHINALTNALANLDHVAGARSTSEVTG